MSDDAKGASKRSECQGRSGQKRIQFIFRGRKPEASASDKPNNKRCLQQARTFLIPERIKRVSHVESRNESVIRPCPPVRFARDLLDLAITVIHHLQQGLMICRASTEAFKNSKPALSTSRVEVEMKFSPRATDRINLR